MIILCLIGTVIAFVLTAYNYGRCTDKSDVRAALVPTGLVFVLGLLVFYLCYLNIRGGP